MANKKLVATCLRNLVECAESLGYTPVSGMLGGAYGYGFEYDSSEFMMKPYCWCEEDGCPWCDYDLDYQQAPNFHHKPSGFKVWWYKYIGRGMRIENPNNVDIVEVTVYCKFHLREVRDNDAGN